MAALSSQCSVKTSNNIENIGDLCTNGCKCHSTTQSDVEALLNELKSISENVNILMNELKCESANKGARKPNST